MCNLNVMRYTGCGCIDSDPIPCSFAPSLNDIHNCNNVFVREPTRNGQLTPGLVFEGDCHQCQTRKQSSKDPSRSEHSPEHPSTPFFFWHIPLAAQDRFLDKFSMVNFDRRTIFPPPTRTTDPNTGQTTLVKGDGYPFRVVEIAHLTWPAEHIQALKDGKIKAVLSEVNGQLCYQQARMAQPTPFTVFANINSVRSQPEPRRRE